MEKRGVLFVQELTPYGQVNQQISHNSGAMEITYLEK